jgi:hypothetical protein
MIFGGAGAMMMMPTTNDASASIGVLRDGLVRDAPIDDAPADGGGDDDDDRRGGGSRRQRSLERGHDDFQLRWRNDDVADDE